MFTFNEWKVIIDVGRGGWNSCTKIIIVKNINISCMIKKKFT